MDIAAFIRHVPDYPKPGILFYDITPLLASPEAFGEVIERMADAAQPLRPTAHRGCRSAGLSVRGAAGPASGRGPGPGTQARQAAL